MKKIIKTGLASLLFIFSIVLFTAASFMLVVVTGPRSIPYLPAQIERLLSRVSDDFTVHVNDAVLKWDGLKNGIGIHLTGVGLIDNNKMETATFPDVEVTLSMSALLSGNIELKDLIIIAPEFKISMDEEISSEERRIGPQPLSVYRKAVIKILSTIERNNKAVPIQNIKMEQMRLLITNGSEEIVWFVNSVDTKFLMVGDVVMFRSFAEANFNGKKVNAKAEGVLEEKRWLRVRSEITDIPANIISDLIPQATWLQKIDMNINGNLTFLLNIDGSVNSVDFQIFNGEKADISSPYAELWGKLDIHEDFNGQKGIPELHANMAVINMPANELHKYWPDNFAFSARKWVTENISGGTYTKATMEINIKPEDFINKKLSNEAINAVVELENANIEVYSDFPAIENVSCTAIFDSNSIEINIHQAKVKNSYIPQTKVKIKDVGLDTVNIKIDGKMEGNAEDLFEFFSLAESSKKDSNIFINKSLKGKAETEYSFNFPIDYNLRPEDVNVSATSRLYEINIADIYKNIPLADGIFTLKLKDKKLEMQGDALLGKIRATIGYNEDFSDKNEYDHMITLGSYLTPLELADLGVPDIGFISGVLKVGVSITGNKENNKIVGKLDTTDAAIDAKAIGFSKPEKEEMEVSFIIDDKGWGPLTIEEFQIVSGSMNAKGTAKLAREKNGLNELNIEKAIFDKNNFALSFYKEEDNNNYSFFLKGKSVNLGPSIEYLSKPVKNREDFGIEFKIDAETAFMVDDVEMSDVSAKLSCTKEYCNYAMFKGIFKEGGAVDMKFVPSEKPEENLRYFNLKSENAGALLKGLGVIKHIKDGMLEASAKSYNEKGSPTEGNLIAKDFMVIKAPVLTKLLTLGSFTGIVELLNGEGISFDKLKSDFTVKDRVIAFSGLRTSGSSLGITTDGRVDTTNANIDLEGAIVPSYTLNSFLGNVPLLGGLLIGKEGEGILATRYKVRGKYSEPEMTVNPLSLLTPGFLRKIWGEKFPTPDPEPEIIEEKIEEPKKQETPINSTATPVSQ